ncbi:prepilin peptidase [Jeotgalibacillus haloalkalitolerans]|uniref:A24 family peptidase n=1 Tax=Jeotgalibacillus haloalkalitolerans TaxID=3104292 RepID=A0ABU5KM68_9BACL|nr:A24 family peptidase [Jeotgalibacillus sp. HH7-29]MDZ5712362.1 A24 family peptidase [Jeotgalibacillus sp. HH7-29]
MTILLTAYFVIAGMLLASFFNVVGLRIPEGQSIVYPGSACPQCKKRLTWKELIPVFSYLIQGGKCKNCEKVISPVYPIIEVSGGILFGLAYTYVGLSVELLVALVFISLLLIISVTDIAYMLIPDKILLFFLMIILPLRILEPLTPWWDALLGAAVGFTLLLLIAIVSKGGMGGGDIKLYAVIGLVLGVKLTLLSFFIATFIGTAAGLVAIYVRKKSRKDPVPFGPSIAAGAVIAYFWGQELISVYSGLFF